VVPLPQRGRSSLFVQFAFPTDLVRRTSKENNAARAVLARVRSGVVLLGRRHSRRGGGETNTAHRRSGGKVNSSCDGGVHHTHFQKFWEIQEPFFKRVLGRAWDSVPQNAPLRVRGNALQEKLPCRCRTEPCNRITSCKIARIKRPD